MTKTCEKCGVEKLADKRFFARDSNENDKLKRWCRTCVKVHGQPPKDEETSGNDGEQ